jgi:hypothetical protein
VNVLTLTIATMGLHNTPNLNLRDKEGHNCAVHMINRSKEFQLVEFCLQSHKNQSD